MVRNRPTKRRGKYSQFEEENILKEILPQLGLEKGICCEFGMRGTKGSNTVALVKQGGWYAHWVNNKKCGKGSWQDIPEDVYKFEVHTIEPDNINDILIDDIDVLSIDIDHNDYYVWEALEQRPTVVIIEINKSRRSGVGPYLKGKSKPRELARTEWGCSKEKMIDLAGRKGYRFYRQTGVNLVFVEESAWGRLAEQGRHLCGDELPLRDPGQGDRHDQGEADRGSGRG